MHPHIRATRIRVLAAVAVAAALLPVAPALAQDEIALLLKPEIGDLRFWSEGNVTHYFSEDVEDQRQDFDMTMYEFNMAIQLWRSDAAELGLLTNVDYWNIDSNARFDETLRKIPDELADIAFGVGYKQILANDWLVGGSLHVGSASDEPFDSSDEMYYRANLGLRVPHTDRNAWVGLLRVNTMSEWPVVSAVGYQFETDKWQGVVGIPFFRLGYAPTEKWAFSAAYAPVDEVKLEAAYRPRPPLKLFAAFEIDDHRFFRADRRNEGDQIEYEEKRLTAGAALWLTEDVRVEASGGYAFDREFGEGNDDDDIDDNEFEIEDGWFAGLNVRARF